AAPAPTSATSALATPAGTTGAGTPAYGQALDITAVEYGFQTLGSVPAGLTTIRLQNRGREPHFAHFFRLNDGVTTEQYLAAVKTDLQVNRPGASTALAVEMGGPSTTAPGG